MFKKRGPRLGITSIFTTRKDFIRPLDIKRPKKFTMEARKKQKIDGGSAQSPHGGILPSLCGLGKKRLIKPEGLLREIMRLTSSKQRIV